MNIIIIRDYSWFYNITVIIASLLKCLQHTIMFTHYNHSCVCTIFIYGKETNTCTLYMCVP